MLEKFCDILVIGNELPGLITAAFLARRGLSVQVIDSDLFIEHPKAPDPVCLTNLHSKLLRSILGRLNIPEVTIQNFLNKESTLQVIFPQNRIDIFDNPLNYYEEMEREFPKSIHQIKDFYDSQARLRHQIDVNELFQQLIPSSWKENRAFKKFVAAQNLNSFDESFEALIQEDKKFEVFSNIQILLAYQKFMKKTFGFQVAELFNPGDGEVFSVHAGDQYLKKILKDRITNYDGVVKKEVQINHLLFRNGIFEGADLDNEHGNILSKYVIWNTHLDKLAQVLPAKFRFRKIKKICSQFKYDYHWFTLRFSVDKKFIPKPMRSNVVVVNDLDKELAEDNFLYLQIKQEKLEQLAVIDVNFLMPPSALNEDHNFFGTYIEAIKAKLVSLMPFCDQSLKFKFPQKMDERPTDTLFPLNENDFEIFKHSAQIHGVTVSNEKNFHNLFKLHYKTPTPNFYITHPQIFGSFGIESKLILGLKVTDLIWQEVEKVKKRAMKSERRIA